MFKQDCFVPCRIERFAFDCGCTSVCGGFRGSKRYSRFDKSVGREGEALGRDYLKANSISLGRLNELGSESRGFEHIALSIAKKGMIESGCFVCGLASAIETSSERTDCLPIQRDNLIPGGPEWSRVIVATPEPEAFRICTREMRVIVLDPIRFSFFDDFHSRLFRD